MDIVNNEQQETRVKWGHKIEFVLSCIGYAVGLGNIWRFPYMCYRNGGGAFLIPYTIMLAFVGLPLFLMELAIGQFGGLSAITTWNKLPLFKGVGWAMCVISAIVAITYNIIISYCLFYLFASFTSELPWQTCRNDWNTENCVERSFNDNMSTVWYDESKDIVNNSTNVTQNLTATTSSYEFWNNHVLARSSNLAEFGTPRWQLVLILLFTWIVIFFCVMKGIKTSGKVVYFTAIFPYIVLVTLLVRGVTLPGAIDGIMFFITPKWQKLAEISVWFDAAVQIFASLGVGTGGLITMSSYNKFNNNCYRDAIIVCVMNCGTSVFAGFTIFSMLGYMSHYTGLPIANVTTQGFGLAFVAYPEAIATLPIAPIWSILFFFMLFTLGLDTEFAICETVLCALEDEWPQFLRGKNKIIFKACACGVLFLLGLPLCCPGSLYLLTLLLDYAGGFTLMVTSILETIAIMYIYGFRRFLNDIKMMIGFKPNYYWQVSWLGITPGMIVFSIVFTALHYVSVTKKGYPVWAEVLGWLTVAHILLCVPVFALIVWYQHGKIHGFTNYRKVGRSVISPTDDWGPAICCDYAAAVDDGEKHA